MVTNMEITTITFPPELKREGEEFAKKNEISFAELVRTALDFHLTFGKTLDKMLIDAMTKGQLSPDEQKKFAPYIEARLGK